MVVLKQVVKVALNEQFMVASLQANSPNSGVPQQHHHRRHDSKQASPEESNRVLRILITRLNSTKTFGENMIFMLNRAGELFGIRLLYH